MRFVLALAALSLAACEGGTDDGIGLDEDPRGDDDKVVDTGDSGYSIQDDGTIDSGGTTVDCTEGPKTTGPWPAHPIIEAGAEATSTAYDFAGGIAEVRKEAVDAGETGRDVNLKVTKAIVVAKDFIGTSTTQANFWVADSSGALLGWTNSDSDRVEALRGVKEGDEIQFTVTRVETYEGMPEISGFADLKVVSSGNAVHVTDVMDPAAVVSFAEHGDDIVEVWGKLDSIENADCGGRTCYNLDYGQDDPVVFRSGSNYLTVGDCVHYIGPVTQFGTDTRLDSDNFDWTWTF